MEEIAKLAGKALASKYAKVSECTIDGSKIPSEINEKFIERLKFYPDEKIEILYMENDAFEKMINLNNGVIVGITNYRIFKLENKHTWMNYLKDIATIKHIKNNIFSWDKINCLLHNGKNETYGVFHKKACGYLCGYLAKKISERKQETNENKTMCEETQFKPKPVITLENPKQHSQKLDSQLEIVIKTESVQRETSEVPTKRENEIHLEMSTRPIENGSEFNENKFQRALLERRKLDKEILEHEKMMHEKLVQERLKQEKLEQEILDRERMERERLEQERLEREKLEKIERLEKIKMEQKRIEHDRNERLERLEKIKLEQKKLEQETLEQGRIEELERRMLNKLQIEQYQLKSKN